MNKDAPPGQPLAVTLDLEKYMSQLDDWDITEDQKTEFIKTFWELLLSFAQIGFEIHPAQQAQNVGRKKPQKPSENSRKPQEKAVVCDGDLLYSRPIIRTDIKRISDVNIISEESEIHL